MSTEFAEIVSEYGSQCKSKLEGPGEAEAAITTPFSNLLSAIGEAKSWKVVAHDQVHELDGSLHPDFAVSVSGALIGHAELKAPGTSLDPDTYGKSTHNFRQWKLLREMPNLLHTNGLEWRLWRSGQLVRPPVFLGGASLYSAGSLLTAGESFDALILDFLNWTPSPITKVSKLVERVAPLARALREEVMAALKLERRAVKLGADKDLQPFLSAQSSWRRLLFPSATDIDFADGYAQTVTFALLLARAEGLDLEQSTLHDVAKNLDSSHSLMGRALDLLTEHASGPVHTAVELLMRVISAVQWSELAKGNKDIYLHLYEDFLEVYDPDLREKTGSYYTPQEVVTEMVRLSEDALKEFFDKKRAFRDATVSVVDGSMGTGTYPLTILDRAAQQAKDEYGPAAAPEAVNSLAQRFYGLEIQSAPFSVAELRITAAIRQAGADLPTQGLNLYVADTLESPWRSTPDQLSYSENLIAAQRRRANVMKRERNVQVVISNPPYEERAGGLGGWIEHGDKDHDAKNVPLNDFKLKGNGKHEGKALKNLYVYFWRWAMWKVFDSTAAEDVLGDDSGIICYITANGYLTGPGFRGMRKYLREQCSHGWIIDVSPEGKRPPAGHGVFNIETPVCIALFIRTPGTRTDVPADIKFVSLEGLFDSKMAQLATLTLKDERLLPVRTEWTAEFTPAASGDWDSWPALDDLMPWFTTGVTSNRAWVYAPHHNILEGRFRALVEEPNPDAKNVLMKSTSDSHIDTTRTPLPHVQLHGEPDTEQATSRPIRSVDVVGEVKTVRVAYRSFDRQYVIADRRLLDRPREPLWTARSVSHQVFVVEQHRHNPGKGPALMFTALMPDQHMFNNRGGRVLPLFHPDGTSNTADGFLDAYGAMLGTDITPQDFAAYLAGVCGHPDFTARFSGQLVTPGIRVPLTAKVALWESAVELGRKVLWLQSFGALQQDPGCAFHDDVRADTTVEHPMYVKPITQLPNSKNYDAETKTLTIGTGAFAPVSPEVANYSVGGINVIHQWLSYRKASPGGRVSSPLDHINAQKWESEWTIEFLDMLSVLTQLTALEGPQREILDQILSEEVLNKNELGEITWPGNSASGKERTATSSTPRLF